jgi:hypothetical protein
LEPPLFPQPATSKPAMDRVAIGNNHFLAFLTLHYPFF